MGYEGGEFKGIDDGIAVEVGAEIGSIDIGDFVRDIKRVDIVVGGRVGISGKEDRGTEIKSGPGTHNYLVREDTIEVGETFDSDVIEIGGTQTLRNRTKVGNTFVVSGDSGGVKGENRTFSPDLDSNFKGIVACRGNPVFRDDDDKGTGVDRGSDGNSFGENRGMRLKRVIDGEIEAEEGDKNQ